MQFWLDYGEDSYCGYGLLQGKKVLIIGGDSGIGVVVVIVFVCEGVDVVIVFFDGEQDDVCYVQQQIEQVGCKVVLVLCDISDLVQVCLFVDCVVSELDGFDILVNNVVYQCYYEYFDDIILDDWKWMFDINVYVVFNLIWLCVLYLCGGGVIINIVLVNFK